MIVLDTDHISVLQHEDSPEAVALSQKLALSPLDEVATTAVTLEEQARSWLSLISRYSKTPTCRYAFMESALVALGWGGERWGR